MAFVARSLLTEMRKLVPDASASTLFKVAVAASAAGWVLASTDVWNRVVRIYGALMFLSGLITSLVTFDPDRD